MYGIVIGEFEDRSVRPRVERHIDDILWFDDLEKLERWVDQGLIERIPLEQGLGQSVADYPWGGISGRDLRAHEPDRGAWRVVALLNFWNDRKGLEATAPVWWPHVDRVVAFDGAYPGTPTDVPHSTDGSVEYLQSLPGAGEKLEVIEPGVFIPQIAKRTELLQSGRLGDLLFIVDSDEVVANAQALRLTPIDCDVGWVIYKNPIYRRPQTCPRVLRWRPGLYYEGRHHYINEKLEDGTSRLVTTHQFAGAGFDHHLLPIIVDNRRGIRRTPRRQQQADEARLFQVLHESDHGNDRPGGREPLRVVHLARFDAGMVIYRLHSAINTTTPHESIMGTSQQDRAYREPAQFHVQRDRATLRAAVETADVIHCHVDYHALQELGVGFTAAVVMHHHGTLYRTDAEYWNRIDARTARVRFVSNLELLQYGQGLHYLPNPVPVVQYRRLREKLRRPDDGEIWIGHSPTKRELKGTTEFLACVDGLQKKGMKIRTVMIEDVSHAGSLELKASCDIFFDSFFLGLQCSGLEAAAMGIPVIAGDETVAAGFERWIGYVPYTFANGIKSLRLAIERLVEYPSEREKDAAKVSAYVEQYHDLAPVAFRYLETLNAELGWKERLGLENFEGKVAW